MASDKTILSFTELEFDCLCEMIETVNSLIGGGDEDFNAESTYCVKHLRKMLKRNGYKRKE